MTGSRGSGFGTLDAEFKIFVALSSGIGCGSWGLEVTAVNGVALFPAAADVELFVFVWIWFDRRWNWLWMN